MLCFRCSLLLVFELQIDAEVGLKHLFKGATSASSPNKCTHMAELDSFAYHVGGGGTWQLPHFGH